MRILLVHNRYQQAGGEDSVVANELALLRGNGHQAELLQADNEAITGKLASAGAAAASLYSWRWRRRVAAAIERFRPDIMHVHNFFPLVSPSLFDAARAARVPSVWTLHNFRVACANGLLFRDGGPCEDCVGRSPHPGVVHRCYRGSLAASATVAAGIALHRARGTWRTRVDRFIALTEFARGKFVEAGLPPEKLVVKPNFVPDPGPPGDAERRGAVYVGRLSVEKGVETLVQAWRDVAQPLTVVGDGPLRTRLEAMACANVTFTGFQDRDQVRRHVAGAELLVIPSIWYENFPMTVVEAFSLATPVLASSRGGLREIVGADRGLLFEAGNARSLAEHASSAFGQPGLLRSLGTGARSYYRDHLSPPANLARLEAIYDSAIGS